MKKLFDFFIARSFLVNLISAFICLIGLIAILGMKRDLIPPMEFQMIQVQMSVPGASTLETEKLVTFPVEDALKGLPGLVRITSETKHDSASFTLQYEAGYGEMQSAVELVRARVFALTPRLPQNMYPPQVYQQKVTEVFLSQYAVQNFASDDSAHRAQVAQLVKKIEQVPGVARTSFQGHANDIYIRFDDKRLQALGISVAKVQRVLVDSLAYASVGRIRHNEVDMAIELAQIEPNIETLGSIPIEGNRNGQVLRLRDLAKIERGTGVLNSKKLFEGQDAGFLTVFKDTQSDSIGLHERVNRAVDKFNAQPSNPLKATLVFEGPKFIKKQIDVLALNGLGGLVLVFLVLMLFLSFRTALMTVIGIPIAYLGTFWVLSVLGIAIDLISIIGMILVVGILVDDAIIVSERYIENLSSGMKPFDAASEAAHSLVIPVTGTVLTTIVAFLPVMLVKSDIMSVLIAVPIVIITSLGISLLESFFILPNHLAHFVSTPPVEKSKKFFERFKALYVSSLRHILKWRYACGVVLVLFTGFSFYVAGTQLKHEFNLNISNQKLRVYAVLKNSPSLEYTAEKIRPIQELMAKFKRPGVGHTHAGIGSVWRDGRSYDGHRYAQIELMIEPDFAEPQRLEKELREAIEPELAKLKTDDFEDLTVKAAPQGKDETKKDLVSVRVRSADQQSFAEVESAILAAVAKQGLIGERVTPEDQEQSAWQFVPDQRQLIRYGLTQGDLGAQMRQIFSPFELTQVRMGGESVKVFMQLDMPDVPRFERLAQYEIRTPLGTSVPLGFLGKWEKRNSLKSVSHRDGQRITTLDFRFDPEKANATTAKAELKSKIEPLKALFPSFDIQAGDADESEGEAQTWALKVGLYSLVGVFFVLAVVLGSVTQPLLVATPIPFGIVGIIWALYVHDLPLGLMAMIGLVGIIGVSVNDSLVMTDHMNQLRKKHGKLDRETIILGASDRLRAIFLTTVTTVAGVLPMAYGIGGESGFTQPLAFAMGWGLLFSTLMTLFFLPSLLQIREDIFAMAPKILARFQREPRATKAEPADLPQWRRRWARPLTRGSDKKSNQVSDPVAVSEAKPEDDVYLNN